MRTIATVTLLGLLSACEPLPGDVVGTYSVTMSLEENTCGPTAVYPLDGKKYAVELREVDQGAYWRIPKQTPVQGDYDAPDFAFKYQSVVATGDADAGARRCRLIQSEELSGSVAIDDAGIPDLMLDGGNKNTPDSADIALAGEHTMTISAEPGADCSEALPPQGAFAKLPCVLRYRLLGTKRKPL